jgi:hypothetical protein
VIQFPSRHAWYGGLLKLKQDFSRHLADFPHLVDFAPTSDGDPFSEAHLIVSRSPLIRP